MRCYCALSARSCFLEKQQERQAEGEDYADYQERVFEAQDCGLAVYYSVQGLQGLMVRRCGREALGYERSLKGMDPFLDRAVVEIDVV